MYFDRFTVKTLGIAVSCFILLLFLGLILYRIWPNNNPADEWLTVNKEMRMALQDSSDGVMKSDKNTAFKGGTKEQSKDQTKDQQQDQTMDQTKDQTKDQLGQTAAAAQQTQQSPQPKESTESNQPNQPAANASGLINLNLATAEQLDELPGIGPSKAKAIMDYRANAGAFKTIDEIMNVKGIGPKIFEKMKSRITVDANS